jgi:hypothetical protein
MRPPAMTDSSSDAHAAAPCYDLPRHVQTPSAVQCSNVPPDRLVPATQPTQLSNTSVSLPANADTPHPIEVFSDFLRRGAIFSTHSSQLLAKTIQNVNGTIRFEYQLNRYRTNWIGELFRIVLSKERAEELYAARECMSLLTDIRLLILTLA